MRGFDSCYPCTIVMLNNNTKLRKIKFLYNKSKASSWKRHKTQFSFNLVNNYKTVKHFSQKTFSNFFTEKLLDQDYSLYSLDFKARIYSLVFNNFYLYSHIQDKAPKSPQSLKVLSNIRISYSFRKEFLFSKALQNTVSFKSLQPRGNFNNTMKLLYLNSWAFYSLYKYGLTRFYINRLPGIYVVPNQYFFFNNVFFPPRSSFLVFKNLVVFPKRFRFAGAYSVNTQNDIFNKSYYLFLKNTSLNFLNFKINFSERYRYNVFYNLLKSIPTTLTSRFRGKRRLLKVLRGKKYLIRISLKTKKRVLLNSSNNNFNNKFLRLHRRRILLLNNLKFVFKPKFSSYNSLSLLNTKLIVKGAQKLSNNSLLINYNPKITSINFFNNKKPSVLLLFLINHFFFKCTYFTLGNFSYSQIKSITNFFRILPIDNLLPSIHFNHKISKILHVSSANMFLKENVIPWVYNNLIKFIEFCSGKKVLIQIYSFVNQWLDVNFALLYKRWVIRLSSYERKLGHRFFLEEALHIIHLSFVFKDVKLLSSWLGAIIKRISFWKTRGIFRFIKYLFNNFYLFIFKDLDIKGFKVKLKGKISVAGNSRKRTILYRVGQTSHSTNNLKVIHNFSTITTFTGVMGFQVWLFY